MFGRMRIDAHGSVPLYQRMNVCLEVEEENGWHWQNPFDEVQNTKSFQERVLIHSRTKENKKTSNLKQINLTLNKIMEMEMDDERKM